MKKIIFTFVILIFIVGIVMNSGCQTIQSMVFGPKIEKVKSFGPIESTDAIPQDKTNIKAELNKDIEEKNILIVTGSMVNIRKGPNTTFEVITQCKKGDEFEILEESGAWFKIKLSDDMEGWIYSKLIVKK